MAKVELRSVSKRFGKVVAVDRVSLTIESGEFFVILGPSGCGKTTLLRLIAGLEVPDEGEIYIDGRLVNDLHPRDRDVAMVFQNYALYPHMTVLNNIMFPLEVRKRELGLSRDEIRRRALEIAKFLGIQDLLERYPRELSGGQQQRVALARALVRKPKVWLLDEPLSNLDAKLRVQMRGELKVLQRRLGITTIYVTHDQVEAMSMADRVAVMNNGRVHQVGPGEELYKRPGDVFVASFIGTPPMNLLGCAVVESETLTLNCSGFIVKFEGGLAEILAKVELPEELYLGVRPEDMIVTKDKSSGAQLQGKVVVVEPLGADNIVTLDLNGSIIKVRSMPSMKLDIGETVYLKLDTSKILVYDGKTGKLLV
ncbi:MAG: ABC transporter ATP-binding protein [Thermoprotei archaeon]|nr:ABC transporter ATP-binding protein [Thermoprotei archaeon]